MYGSSQVGKLIFEKAMRQVEIDSIGMVVASHVKQLKDLKGVTLAAYKRIKAEFEAAAKARGMNPNQTYTKAKEVD